MHVRSSFLSAVMVAAALVCTPTPPVSAQVVRGHVVDGVTQAPISGAFILLLDSAGTRRGGVLSGEGGSYILPVPGAGRYTLRADRIGYASATSDTLKLEAGRTLVYRFEISIQPIDLVGMQVTGRGRCRVSREMGAQTSLLWDEVHKALSIALWGDRERGVPFQTKIWSRARDIVSLEVLGDTVHLASGYGRTPFASESAQSLGAKGYIRRLADGSYMFYGVDAQTLLSDDFVAGHCFRVEKAGEGQEGLVGLGFEPIHRSGQADIVGTLWVDRATSELRYLDFKYDRIPMAGNLPTEPFGGRVYFRRLGNGDWVVQRWWLRMPQSVGALETDGGGPPGWDASRRVNARRYRQRGLRIHEQGGEIRFIGAAGTSEVEGHATLSGTVFDSTRMMPLGHANVFLTDINRATTTDVFGHFRLEDLPAGAHQVAFTHSYTDFLGLAVSPMTVTVSPNRYASVMLTVPKAAGCATTTGGVVGFVESEENGDPLPGGVVRAGWWIKGADRPVMTKDRWEERADTADAQGRYLFCDVPLHTDVELAADGGATVEMELGAPGLVWQALLTRIHGG